MARLTEIVHDRLAAHLKPGDKALDATAGNGHDTIHLARLVGPGGRVVAVDRQKAALVATRRRLTDAGLLDRCILLHGDHASLIPTLGESFQAAVFNLGYLPGSDKSVITEAAGTVAALDHCRERLGNNGLLLVTAYRGHPGGEVEAEAVGEWMIAREAEDWSIHRHEPPTRGDTLPPILWTACPGLFHLDA